jgi:hypothetical protein
VQLKKSKPKSTSRKAQDLIQQQLPDIEEKGMPPRHRAAAPSVTDPHDQALLGRLLLQLKLKLAGLVADASARPQRECTRAAQEVESAVSHLEAGPPLLRAARNMVRTARVSLALTELLSTKLSHA